MSRELIPELHDAIKITVLQHHLPDSEFSKFSNYVDSVGKPPSVPEIETNLYSYAFNNPVRYIDPYGLFGWDIVIKFFSKQLAKWGLKDPMDKIVPMLSRKSSSSLSTYSEREASKK